ncbi:hypothetical protein B0H14DRAFT_2581069 [Mycena olivaceomarginata]|nr:hypothetical protein B0H14DRAFT_2581069 [Mycena olivaceomarginata]
MSAPSTQLLLPSFLITTTILALRAQSCLIVTRVGDNILVDNGCLFFFFLLTDEKAAWAKVQWMSKHGGWRSSTGGRGASADGKQVTGTKGMEGGLGLGSEDPAPSFDSLENCAPAVGDTLSRVPTQKNQARGGRECEDRLILAPGSQA